MGLIFDTPLIEGIIQKRSNRFIMQVELEGTIYNCHCPTTGRIGNIVLEGIPCLLSKDAGTTRNPPLTVEAISLDLPTTAKKNMDWNKSKCRKPL
ncbi:sugar fermentation stimulation protein [Muricomes intestini]|uniref:Sugar fermentation stimulation protein n=1 Tax=Muricomes intestini TaxID=1796634 RepID=A0A4R3K5A8_9FIRM|nr:hypothetical protein [Muricomes intestini]TCS77851.1 sugar fermentation stimulation protein [Muricomes intestini]